MQVLNSTSTEHSHREKFSTARLSQVALVALWSLESSHARERGHWKAGGGGCARLRVTAAGVGSWVKAVRGSAKGQSWVFGGERSPLAVTLRVLLA